MIETFLKFLPKLDKIKLCCIFENKIYSDEIPSSFLPWYDVNDGRL
jgi:hypothetical protein